MINSRTTSVLAVLSAAIVLLVGFVHAGSIFPGAQELSPDPVVLSGFGYDSGMPDDEDEDGDDEDCDVCEDCGAKALVAVTGQVDCWSGAGAPIDCAGSGQDGESQAGVPNPLPRFTDNLDGTVTDNLTGLTFLEDADCFGLQQWAPAVSLAAGLADGACGLSDGSVVGDWRLPNVRELGTLVDFSQSFPALPPDHLFVNVALDVRYWTSTTSAFNPMNAWVVGINGVGPTRRAAKTELRRLIAVRN